MRTTIIIIVFEWAQKQWGRINSNVVLTRCADTYHQGTISRVRPRRPNNMISFERRFGGAVRKYVKGRREGERTKENSRILRFSKGYLLTLPVPRTPVTTTL
jgi:hypothetical protein